MGRDLEQAEPNLQMEAQSACTSSPSSSCHYLLTSYYVLDSLLAVGSQQQDAHITLSIPASGHIKEDESHLYPLCRCAHMLVNEIILFSVRCPNTVPHHHDSRASMEG